MQKFTYPDEYFIPMYRNILNRINRFKEFVAAGDTEKAFELENQIGNLAANLTERNRKSINKIMKDTEGTRLRWVYREKKVEEVDEDDIG